MLIPLLMASLIIGSQSFGIFPPEGAIPKTNTSAPFFKTSSKLEKIGISLSISCSILILLPAFSVSITPTIGFSKYLIIPKPIFPKSLWRNPCM